MAQLQPRNPDARSHDAVFHRGLLCRGVSLRQSLPEAEVAMDLITLIAIVLSALLLAYLTATLLFPEKF
jgi:K+-transporting ATPase KdpF subunit